jgi:hypothetical protein
VVLEQKNGAPEEDPLAIRNPPVSLNKSQILLENIWRKSYYILEARLALLESRLFELWADFYCISLSGQTL